MYSADPATLSDGKLPIFVFPNSLYFYSDDQSSHKQVLTVYNPYEFPLKFKVLCTSPKKYSVVDSEGTIKPHCCVDIVVRHTDICLNNEGLKDKFRLQVFEHGHKKSLGRKDIQSVLLPTKDKSQLGEETFEQLPGSSSQSDSPPSIPFRPDRGNSGPSFVIIMAAIMCILALMLPTTGESSSLPDYLFISLHQKLIAAYILGLVTMAILRS